MKKRQPHVYCPFYETKDEVTNHNLHCVHNDTKGITKDALWEMIEPLVQIGTCSDAFHHKQKYNIEKCG